MQKEKERKEKDIEKITKDEVGSIEDKLASPQQKVVWGSFELIDQINKIGGPIGPPQRNQLGLPIKSKEEKKMISSLKSSDQNETLR